MAEVLAATVETSEVPRAARTGLVKSMTDVVTVNPVASNRAERRNSPRKGGRTGTPADNSIASEKIEEDLKKFGYEVRERIVIEYEGEPQMNAIQVVSPLGETAFVKIDQTRVHVTRNDLTYLQSGKASVIPDAWKKGNYKCAGSNVIGVAIVCNNNICMYVSDADPNKPYETNFIYVTKHNDRRAVIGDNPVSYPVVRLSELYANHQLVTKNIHEATVRIRKELTADLIRELQDSDSIAAKIDELKKEFELTRASILREISWVDKSLAPARDTPMFYQAYFVEHEPCDDLEVQKMLALRRILSRFNGLYAHSLWAAYALSAEKDNIEKSADNFRAIREFVEKEGIGLKEDLAKACKP